MIRQQRRHGESQQNPPRNVNLIPLFHRADPQESRAEDIPIVQGDDEHFKCILLPFFSRPGLWDFHLRCRIRNGLLNDEKN